MTRDESDRAKALLRDAGLIAKSVSEHDGRRDWDYRVHWQSSYASGSFEDYADTERIIAAQGKAK